MRPALLILLAASALSGSTPGELAAQIKKLELDPAACYQVREVHFAREDLRFYLNEGLLIFAKPVAGKRLAAVFSGAVEGGDAEVLLMPPSRGERLSLSSFTGSPNLNEHFRGALFLFTDDTADVLMRAIQERGEPKPALERGLLLAGQWNSVLGNLASSFGVGLVLHLLGAGSPGMFYGAIQGAKLGNFDVFHDQGSSEQIFAGALASAQNTLFYDIWTSFPARPTRGAKPAPRQPEFRMDNFRIRAQLDPELKLSSTVTADLIPNRGPIRVIPLDISDRMAIRSAKVNGEEAELFTSESLRANLARRNESALFLVIPKEPLPAGKTAEVEISYEGAVVRQSGRGVYFVGSRANWYPRPFIDWANFDVTFTYPAGLQLVFAGDVREDRVDGELRTTRRVTPAPVRIAGFNLGHYESVKETRGNLTVEVYANKSVEPGLRRSGADFVLVPPITPPFPRRGQSQPNIIALPPMAMPDPTRRLDPLANDVADAFQYFATHFGPPALNTLRVSPIPGSFGQGFPGLVYLSTMSYLNPSDRPASAQASDKDRFFSEILYAHEVAHQWWGNAVTSAGAQDDWLMEALANYSALMVVERKKGAKAMQQALDDFRQKLLARDAEGKTVESAGPIRLGGRLISSQAPLAWHAIVYYKGAWILHMLRKQMGDDLFLKMLGGLARQYRHKRLSAREFQAHAAGYLPKGFPDPKLEAFFEQWVENSGIPEIEMATQVRRTPLGLSITVTQTGVSSEFSVRVPVEIQIPRAKPQIVWVATGPEPATVTVPLRAVPGKVALDPDSSLLIARK
ncbi:MAG: M1 family metallopeptidase [Acidobacteria bacterium]|nr:M1 family metallopeptidase [Acidobacteriota bacterium]